MMHATQAQSLNLLPVTISAVPVETMACNGSHKYSGVQSVQQAALTAKQ